MAARSAVVEAALALLRIATDHTRIIGEDPVASVAEQALRVNPLSRAVCRLLPHLWTIPRFLVTPLHGQQVHCWSRIVIVTIGVHVVRTAWIRAFARRNQLEDLRRARSNGVDLRV